MQLWVSKGNHSMWKSLCCVANHVADNVGSAVNEKGAVKETFVSVFKAEVGVDLGKKFKSGELYTFKHVKVIFPLQKVKKDSNIQVRDNSSSPKLYLIPPGQEP